MILQSKGLQEVRKIVHDLKPEQMDKKQLDIALEEFFHEVQVKQWYRYSI